MALPLPLLHVQHQENTTVEGGSTSTGVYNIRPLNTVLTNTITGASLASNQITLAAGTYFIDAAVSGNSGRQQKLLLWNDSDSSFAVIGQVSYSNSTALTDCSVVMRGRFTIAAEKTFELQHYTTTGRASTGMGLATDDGTTEVYADVLIWEINGDELDSIHVKEELATTGDGGGSAAGAFQVRALTDVKHNTITGASLGSNQVTLPAGTYQVSGTSTNLDGGNSNLNIYNTTTSAYIAFGSNIAHPDTPDTGAMNRLGGQFVLEAESVLELRYWTSTARSSIGLGFSVDDGEIESYSDLIFTKVA